MPISTPKIYFHTHRIFVGVQDVVRDKPALLTIGDDFGNSLSALSQRDWIHFKGANPPRGGSACVIS